MCQCWDIQTPFPCTLPFSDLNRDPFPSFTSSLISPYIPTPACMPDARRKPVSPVSHVLHSLGLTREDLVRHSDQMRQFLTTEDQNSLRVLGHEMDSQLSQRASSRSSSALARSASRGSSSVYASPSPMPRTPVKAEPSDGGMPPRHFDSMEAVLERKSRMSKLDKKSRRVREKEREQRDADGRAPSMDAFMRSRSRDERVHEHDTSLSQEFEPPITPRMNKYYRPHTHETSSSRSQIDVQVVRPASPNPYESSANKQGPPVTPSNHYKSPLPFSSPPPSSPMSSSPTRAVNLVSSPGPMGPPPNEDEYDKLPYRLPSGPYSPRKPDLSYAALVGQAILCSPEHRLTLQEIYDWITIVYPHFKRGETTWMNSIRHVLSTTACFRKVIRERSVGRTLWAIWDCDLECFKDGGFNKKFCSDMMGDKVRSSKKRPGDDTVTKKNAKRQKKAAGESQTPPPEHRPMILPAVQSAHTTSVFPPVRPSAHHQPYYANYYGHAAPSEAAFPSILTSFHSSAVASTSHSRPSRLVPAEYSDGEDSMSPPPISSVPSLTPNDSSSSPLTYDETPIDAPVSQSSAFIVDSADDDHDVFGRVRASGALRPGLSLLVPQLDLPKRTDKGKGRELDSKPWLHLAITPISPTNRQPSSVVGVDRAPSPRSAARVGCTTPPPQPSTPPRKVTRTVTLSPVRTPLSHKGLHMSPSPSLAHYKSHLDPPPVVAFLNSEGHFLGAAAHDTINTALLGSETVRTPSRKRSGGAAGLFGPAITPKRSLFLAAGGSQESPIRTPGGRGGIFDPHDPGTLLDEELARFGAMQGMHDSPVGIFDRGKGLLYESPNIDSPGRLPRWW